MQFLENYVKYYYLYIFKIFINNLFMKKYKNYHTQKFKIKLTLNYKYIKT